MELEEMALPGKHDFVLQEFRRRFPQTHGLRVLDLGAGQGALAARLRDLGCEVHACDVNIEQLRVEGVEKRQVDAEAPLPYADESFDAVLAVEVAEHVDNHRHLFSEIARILKPSGALLFTTPNILSLKSRVLFLFTGYFYSHSPLPPGREHPCFHISLFPVGRYVWLLSLVGIEVEGVETDKRQNSSRALLWLYPLIRWFSRRRFRGRAGGEWQNSLTSLLGRGLLVIGRKSVEAPSEPTAGR